MKYITIGDNAEVGITDDTEGPELLILTPAQAKDLLIALTAKMRMAGII
jgi:hypothetical protein